MPLDWSTLHRVLRDETRKKIILNLQTAGMITYTDLMSRLEITNTGKLNYHLKMLNDLIVKNDQGAYILTERGKAAADLLDKFPTQMTANKTLHAFDALIIGLVGLLTSIPIFFIPITPLIPPPVLLPLYLLLVPSLIMWRLTTRRTNSHDLYELMKAPVVVAGISYLLILLAIIIPILRAASPPPPITNTTATTTTTSQPTFIAYFALYFLSPIIPLVGVLLIEGLYRFRNR